MDFIEQHVPLKGRILDVGCGNGIFTTRLTRQGGTVYGLDYSSHLLATNPHKRLIHGDATVLPFADASFDVVFEANLLHHVPSRLQAMSEMARVSRRYVVILEPNRYNPLMFAFGLVVKEERGLLVSCQTRLRQEMEAAGLRVRAAMNTGMISQNNTPQAMLPWLKRFDRSIWWGEYSIVIGEKSPQTLM
jgi:ubiquinone/menaquinone biosynthesis C-methylase UbiE